MCSYTLSMMHAVHVNDHDQGCATDMHFIPSGAEVDADEPDETGEASLTVDQLGMLRAVHANVCQCRGTFWPRSARGRQGSITT